MITALSKVSPTAIAFPAVPPKTSEPSIDAMGVFSYPDPYFSLNISAEMVEEIGIVLMDRADGLGWSFDEASNAIEVIGDLAQNCGGGLVTPEQGVVLPSNLSKRSADAIRAACSKDLVSPRIVVTTELGARALGRYIPVGASIGFDQRIDIMSPIQFRDFAEKIRWGMRKV